jgi:hypothetical protein
MGLFSGSRKTSVSATVYNLAGDVLKRPDYRKTTVVGALLSSTSDPFPQQMNDTYLHGPGVRLRNFARWCIDTGYNTALGILQSQFIISNGLDWTALAAAIPHTTDQTVEIQSASVGPADYQIWADQYMAINHQDQIGTDYLVEYNSVTNVITITLIDSSTESFTPTDFVVSEQYLYAVYDFATYDTGGTKTVSDIQVLIYKQNSGNTTYDGFFGTTSTGLDFVPFIPVRLANTFLSGSFQPTIYAEAQRVYKRITNYEFDDLVTKISANPSLGDIDYAYVFFGVSINVVDNASRRYIYTFFQQIALGLSLSDTAYQTWLTAWNASNASVADWNDWNAAQSDPTNPRYGTTAPTKLPAPTAPSNSMRIHSTNATLNWDYQIIWSGIAETTGSGLKKPGALTGEVWLEKVAFVSGVDRSTYHIRINWQVDQTTWRSLDIYDLHYLDFIYGGDAVGDYAYNLLDSASEVGFLIPINESFLKLMPLPLSTQVATACTFLVFTSITTVTAPWYTSDFFKIILVVAVVVITVATAGVGDIGILGSSAALGATLGFDGLTASIVGAVANAVAAMVLVQVIQSGAVLLFGDKLGAIIGTIAAILALQVGTALAGAGNLAEAFNSLMRADNLIKLTDALGRGYSAVEMSKAQDILKETSQLISAYNTDTKDIMALSQQMLGYDHGLVDTLSLVDVKSPVPVVPSESPKDFLSRTLLTGSDISDLSMGMISRFSEIMLNRDVVLS